MINTKELLNKIFTDGGFSVQVASGVMPSSGYMVSLQGCEEVYYTEEVTNDTIPGYITRHVKQLLIPGSYLGGWLDGCKVYLDVSINVDDLRAALDLARENSQLAIYDIGRDESIYLPGDMEELYSEMDIYDYRQYLEYLDYKEYTNERDSLIDFSIEEAFKDYE